MFTLPEQNVPITFHVWDYVRILSNVSLGTATLDPSTIAPNTAVDMWLPISTQGELHIFAQSTPLTARNPAKGTRLSTFRMILERTVFFPGETIRGALVFNVGPPLKIRGVRVKFEGYTRTHWTETHGTGNNRRTTHYHSHIVYFNPVATLYGNPRGVRGDMIIPSAGYYWPFEFVLPSNLAPSYSHSFGSNQYFAKGYVDIPMGFDKTVTETLKMTVQYGTLQPVLYTKSSEKAKAIFASDQNISVSVSTPPVAYMGQTTELVVNIVNRGTKAVREVLVSLNMKAFFTAHGFNHGTKVVGAEITNHKISGVAGFPIPPGQSWSGKIRIQIPDKIAPSIPGTCSPLIQIYHTLKTRVNTEGNFFTKASNEKKFPILVGEVYPFMPTVVAPPPPQQQPGMIVVAQPPPEVYRYLAPAPMVGDQYNPVGQVVPHDVFAAQGVMQVEQYVEEVPNSTNFDPNQAYGPQGYTLQPQGTNAQQGYMASPPQQHGSPAPQQGSTAQTGYMAPQQGYAAPQPGYAQQGYASPQGPSPGPYGSQPQQQSGYAPSSANPYAQPGHISPQGSQAQLGYAPQQQGSPAPQGSSAQVGYMSPQQQGSPTPQGYASPQQQYASPQPGHISPQGSQAQLGYAAPQQGHPASQQGYPANAPNPYATQGSSAQVGYQP